MAANAGVILAKARAVKHGASGSEIRSTHIKACERQYDHQEGEAAQNRSVDVDLEAALRKVLTTGIRGDGFLFGEQIRDDVAEFAWFWKDGVDRDDSIIIAALEQR